MFCFFFGVFVGMAMMYIKQRFSKGLARAWKGFESNIDKKLGE